MAKHDLKPCPLCNGVSQFNHCSGGHRHYVLCTECGLYSHPFDSEKEAAEFWNNRPLTVK